MILLDTHVWVWWVNGSPRLTPRLRSLVEAHESTGLGVSVLSCWEAAKLVERGKLALSRPIREWIEEAVDYPGIKLFQLTPRIAVLSTQLPQPFHRDPADQIIVATALAHKIPLLTADQKLLAYPHVGTLS